MENFSEKKEAYANRLLNSDQDMYYKIPKHERLKRLLITKSS